MDICNGNYSHWAPLTGWYFAFPPLLPKMSLSLNVQCITVNGWMVNAREVNKLFKLRTDFRWPHLFSVGMKKVLEEVGDRLICDVSTHHYVTPGVNLKRLPDEKKIVSSPPFILKGSTIFAALSKQFDDLRDGGGKESKTNCEEENLKKGDVSTTQYFYPPILPEMHGQGWSCSRCLRSQRWTWSPSESRHNPSKWGSARCQSLEGHQSFPEGELEMILYWYCV